MRLDNEPPAVLMGHPLLFEKQKEVSVDTIASEDFQHNLSVLKSSQDRLQGIGLAAPQISWPVRALSLGIDAGQQPASALDIPFQIWINPRVKAVSPTTCWAWEGCLSVPGISGWVERPSHIDVEGYDENSQMRQVRMNGFMARVFQHELDHLNGILFPMRIQDIHLLIPSSSMGFQEDWARDWPTANARKASYGMLSPAR